MLEQSQPQAQIKLRLPPDLKLQLQRLAVANRRSANAEALVRLAASLAKEQERRSD